MTKKELSTLLEQYPDNMQVTVSCDRLSRDIVDVDKVVELGTNVVSVDIRAEDKPSLDEIVRQVKESMYVSRYE